MLIWADSVSLTVGVWLLLAALGAVCWLMFKIWKQLEELTDVIKPSRETADLTKPLGKIQSAIDNGSGSISKLLSQLIPKEIGEGQNGDSPAGGGEVTHQAEDTSVDLRVGDLLREPDVEYLQVSVSGILEKADTGDWALASGYLCPGSAEAKNAEAVKRLDAYFDVAGVSPGSLAITIPAMVHRVEGGYRFSKKGKLRTIASGDN